MLDSGLEKLTDYDGVKNGTIARPDIALRESAIYGQRVSYSFSKAAQVDRSHRDASNGI